mmetsp:Transcript_5094/g.15489  ORF Transcript_5094/g.15489 Transcript_5094/m.15489 type:complete len:208 (-) Transcript_5094:90-713(-)
MGICCGCCATAAAATAALPAPWLRIQNWRGGAEHRLRGVVQKLSPPRDPMHHGDVDIISRCTQSPSLRPPPRLPHSSPLSPHAMSTAAPVLSASAPQGLPTPLLPPPPLPVRWMPSIVSAAMCSPPPLPPADTGRLLLERRKTGLPKFNIQAGASLSRGRMVPACAAPDLPLRGRTAADVPPPLPPLRSGLGQLSSPLSMSPSPSAR